MIKKSVLGMLLALILATTAFGYYSNAETCVIYKVGDNTITQEVQRKDVKKYISNYEWSVEPTTLMYRSNGTTSWICESEVGDYLATGDWFMEKPINITMNVFEKTNLKPEQLEKILTKGLSGYGQVFYDMEQKYGINSIFAISVAELESGHGTSYAFRKRNNAFGIGSGKRFSSVEAGIDYFGQLMNKALYYGKSIDKIGKIYCTNSSWANKVKSLMQTNYSGLGY